MITTGAKRAELISCFPSQIEPEEGEEWRQLVVFRYLHQKGTAATGYAVSNHGRVARFGVQPGQGRRQTGDYLLNPVWIKSEPYAWIEGRYLPIARLVAYAFLELPLVPFAEVGYKDTDRTNLQPGNLEWRTRHLWAGGKRKWSRHVIR